MDLRIVVLFFSIIFFLLNCKVVCILVMLCVVMLCVLNITWHDVYFYFPSILVIYIQSGRSSLHTPYNGKHNCFDVFLLVLFFNWSRSMHEFSRNIAKKNEFFLYLSENHYVFTDKREAFLLLKQHKEARLKEFKTNEDAVNFSKNGIAVLPVNTTMCSCM